MNTFTMLNRAQRILVATVAVLLAAAFAISAGHNGSSDRAATKEWKSKNVVTAATKEWKASKDVVVATKEWKATVTVK